MCGLVGCAGLITSVEERLFRQLLVLDSIRGEHSTGVAAVNMLGAVDVAKTVGDPFQLFETKSYEGIMRQANRVLIGHNRYATTGKINRRNAHPFEFDGLVGAHNGTLHNKYALKNHNDFDVDSEALYSHINEEGLDAAIKLVRGAWALTWYDKDNETINFLRNEERPLFYCISENKKVIFWASEAWMLQSVFSREGYKIGKVYVLPTDTHYSFTVSLKDAANHTFDKAKARHVKGAPPLQQSTVTYFSGHQSKKVDTKTTETTTHTKSSYDDAYLGRKIVFEVGGIDKDTAGIHFVFLDDSLKPDYDVRLYSHLQVYTIGTHISAIVNACRRDDNGELYYTVDPKTITEIKLPPISNSQFKHEHKDNSGNVISDEDLKEYYSTCCWCSSPIDHDSPNNIYMGIAHGVACGDCSADPTVKSFLRSQ